MLRRVAVVAHLGCMRTFAWIVAIAASGAMAYNNGVQRAPAMGYEDLSL